MRTGRGIPLMFAVVVAWTLLIHPGSDWSPLEAQAGVALTGRVTSDQEGPMEGVVVTARKDGSTISTSVVTDDKGRYNFPETKLESGDYLLKIRAIGYELVGPAGIDVRGGVTATADIRLRPTTNIAAQLTNAEWLTSMPGSDQQKKFLLACNSCHSYQPIVNSTHDAGTFLQVFDKMAGYYPGSTLLHPQRCGQRHGRRGHELGPARQSCRGVARHRKSQQRPGARLPVQDAATAQRARDPRDRH